MRKIFTFLFAALMSVGMWADPNIATPTISGDLSFTESTTVTMECTSPNSDIYYTTDGVTDPRCDCAAAPEYKQPITITETTIIKAAAYDGNDWSAVAEVTFTKVPASDPAATVVTITDSDFPSEGQSFTKDGVTVSAVEIDGSWGSLLGGGSFSTTLGNFTKIEVSANLVNISGEGWSGDYEHKTWTGNASSVSFSGDIYGDGVGVTLKFTIAESAPQPQMDKTAIYAAYPAENHPAEIEIAFVNRDFTWGMEALDNKPWYASELNFMTSAEDTIKFRDKANNAKILCEFIPVNGGQDGRWQQMYVKMANYEVVSFKGEMVRLIEELDLRDAAKYAWMENAPEPFPEGIENIVLTEKAKKVVVDGVIYIVRDGKLFNLTGAQVK